MPKAKSLSPSIFIPTSPNSSDSNTFFESLNVNSSLNDEILKFFISKNEELLRVLGQEKNSNNPNSSGAVATEIQNLLVQPNQIPIKFSPSAASTAKKLTKSSKKVVFTIAPSEIRTRSSSNDIVPEKNEMPPKMLATTHDGILISKSAEEDTLNKARIEKVDDFVAIEKKASEIEKQFAMRFTPAACSTAKTLKKSLKRVTTSALPQKNVSIKGRKLISSGVRSSVRAKPKKKANDDSCSLWSIIRRTRIEADAAFAKSKRNSNKKKINDLKKKRAASAKILEPIPEVDSPAQNGTTAKCNETPANFENLKTAAEDEILPAVLEVVGSQIKNRTNGGDKLEPEAGDKNKEAVQEVDENGNLTSDDGPLPIIAKLQYENMRLQNECLKKRKELIELEISIARKTLEKLSN